MLIFNRYKEKTPNNFQKDTENFEHFKSFSTLSTTDKSDLKSCEL